MVGDSQGARIGFKRHFVWPGLICTVLEVIFVVVPLLNLFAASVENEQLVRIGLPAACGAQLLWWLAMASWLRPVYRAIREKRRGKRLDGDLAAAAYSVTIRLPIYTLLLRTLLWGGIGITVGLFLVRLEGWTTENALVLTAAAMLFGFAVNTPRSLWYGQILGHLRQTMFSSVPRLQGFADRYRADLGFASLVTCGATAGAIVSFIYFSLPIADEQFIAVLAMLPIALLVSIVVLVATMRASTAKLGRFLDDALGDAFGAGSRQTRGEIDVAANRSKGRTSEAEVTDDKLGPVAVYRLSQVLPYRLAGLHVLVWLALGGAVAFTARKEFRIEFDDAILLFGIVGVIAIGTALYQAIWHRGLMREILDDLTINHRLPVRGIKPLLSLRGKLLVSFGGMVLFACGLALFWGFIQYKKLVTDFTEKQAELGMAWLRSEVSGAASASENQPSPTLVRAVLQGVGRSEPKSSAVFYYMPPNNEFPLERLGGGLMGAPILPWYARAQLRLDDDGPMKLGSHSLSGRRGRLRVNWRGSVFDLGVVAVFYPTYRGRGVAVVREIRDLLLFFLVLFGTCGGIVLLTVAQFVRPIRLLEQRADAMARGELAKPVSAGGEGDEIGRLTFAMEEMRRALRDKLRSTEEVNLDLERAVQRRTADLAKKNRELAETLAKLTHAQDQLVRSEKMASIGQLIAGIAHEINNPVNAIVNTVGPMSETASSLDSGTEADRREAADDLMDMLGVVRRGAERTKAIVSALHNYSRTDDENVVHVDLNRGIDDSLELLRHLLKQDISLKRDYAEVGKIRAHAGQLGQVFVNLIANAAQAVIGQNGAEIRIVTKLGGDDSVIVEIADNGKGIDSDVLPRIFDPFFTTKDVGEGSGLGLSIVHGIVERHGGTIEVESSVGVGTSFVIELPRNLERPSKATV